MHFRMHTQRNQMMKAGAVLLYRHVTAPPPPPEHLGAKSHLYDGDNEGEDFDSKTKLTHWGESTTTSHA